MKELKENGFFMVRAGISSEYVSEMLLDIGFGSKLTKTQREKIMALCKLYGVTIPAPSKPAKMKLKTSAC